MTILTIKKALGTKYPNVQFDDISLKQILNALKETNIIHDTMNDKDIKDIMNDDPLIIYNNTEFLISYYQDFNQNELTAIFEKLTEFQTVNGFVLNHFNDNTMKLNNGSILELREDF